MNFDHKSKKIAVVGMSGTGKTTRLLQILLSLAKGYKWIFVFDPELEVARKLGWKAASTPQGLEYLWSNGLPIVFYPGKMFPDDNGQGFSLFCEFVIKKCRTVNGAKLVMLDEVQESTELHSAGIPKAFRQLLNLGRREEIDLLIGGQSLNDVHTRVRRQLTEIYVFKQVETDTEAFKKLAQIGVAPKEVISLPHSSQGRIGFIYRNLLTGQTVKKIHALN